jgi:hypothetical protein
MEWNRTSYAFPRWVIKIAWQSPQTQSAIIHNRENER